MNVDCRGWRTSVVRGRVLVAGAVLLAAGCVVLGWGSRFGSAGDRAAAPVLSDYWVSGHEQVQSRNEGMARARALLSGMPLRFEPNQGQWNLEPSDPRARYVAQGQGYSLLLGSEGAILNLAPGMTSSARSVGHVDSVQMKLAGANQSAVINAAEVLPGKSNYFLGNDPSKWRTGVPQFARVRYEQVYAGINLVFYGNQGQLEYDFQVAPGADPSIAEIEFNGAKKLELSSGALVIKTEGGSVRLEAPRVYQEIAGKKQAVDARFVLRAANRAGFAIGAYDKSRELVIDPILTFSTYFGGSGDEHATSVAVDGAFNIYLTGSTTSPNLPDTTAFFQPGLVSPGPNAYIARITPPLGSTSASLFYVTYLGGNGSDTPVGIKVDGRGDAFVAGTTTSTNFPTTSGNAYQPTPETPGNEHVFATELRNDGVALLYSTYLSGNGNDVASGMTIDAGGNMYVTGTTTSVETATTDQFPASNLQQGQLLPYQSTSKLPGQKQFFVTKINTLAPRTGSISYSTYFGGANFTPEPPNTGPTVVGGGIAVDTSNNVYFSGTTNYTYTGCAGCSTTDFPILNAFQPCLDQAPPTVVVNPPTCPTSTSTPASDAFVAKLNLNPNVGAGQQLVWSTYVGGTGDDSSSGVALDPGAANVYLIGTTDSTDIGQNVTSLSKSASFQRCLDTPVNPTAGATCPTPGALATDAFVARVTNVSASTTTTPNIVALNYFSYLGGTGNDAGLAITVDSASGAVVTGWTESADFPVQPTPSSIQTNPGGGRDAFVARLFTAAVVGQTTQASWSSYFGGSGTDMGTGVTLDANQNTYLAGETNSPSGSGGIQEAKPLPSTEGGGYRGGYDAFVTEFGTAVSLSINGILTLGTSQTFISAGNPAQFTYTVTNNGPDLATNVTITDNFNTAITGVPLTNVSASVTGGTCGAATANSIVSCTLPSLQSGSTTTVTITMTPTGNPVGNQATFNGGTVQAIGQGNIVLAETSVPATMSDFSMTVGPPSQTVPVAGATATYQVSLFPRPLYTSAISLSCSGLPTGATCNFTPSSSITVQSTSGATATLSIPTTARPVTTTASASFTRGLYALWFAVPGMSLLFVGIGGDRRKRRIAGMLMLCTVFAMLLLIPACSHTTTQTPVSGTPAGNYTITVTAISGTDSKSQTVGLVVP